jgi:polyisoprenyl-phosphate glycosyltransferase
MSNADLTSAPSLFVLIPVFEDRRSASKLLEELAKITPHAYVVAVEDGSVLDPLQVSDIARSGLSGEIVFLTRNMGHQRAIAAGLTHITHSYNPQTVVVMDSDGEDQPESLLPLVRVLVTQKLHAVVAQRRRRSEPVQFRVFYLLYRILFHILTGRSIHFGNFAALNGYALRRLCSMQELWVHFPASITISRLLTGAVPTDRGKRYFGSSKMNFIGLALHGMRSVMVFTEDVLVRVGIFCTVVAALTVLLLVITTVLKVIGFATPGWFSTASGILFLILMQAAVLEFVTLMLTGVVRSSAPVSRTQLNVLIERVEKTAD